MIDSYHFLHPFYNMIIQGVLITPLFIISFKKSKQPIELLQFFILYSSILIMENNMYLIKYYAISKIVAVNQKSECV